MIGRASVRRFASVALVAAALLVGGFSEVPGASAAPRWADARTAAIRPGNQMAGCTSNFVFTNGADVLLGFAAHCVGLGSSSDTNGCTTPSLPLGTAVRIEGATRPGTVVYSSWAAMQRVKEPNTNACAFNDFALVRVDPADVAKVNPTVPHWGGPTGVATSVVQRGDQVFTYGNSSYRFGLRDLSPKRGQSQGPIGGNWNFRVRTITTGIPGDSGSAFMNNQGKATGVLSTLNPVLLQNGVANLNFAMVYARAHGVPQLQLALGTLPFKTTNNNA